MFDRSRTILGLAALLGGLSGAALAAPPPAEPATETPTTCSEVSWAQGARDAEVTLRLWIDPFTKGSGGGSPQQYGYDAWLQLRDILVDRGINHSFRIEVAVVRRRSGGVDSGPAARDARNTFMTLLEAAGPGRVLRAMTRSAGYDLELATRRDDARIRLAESVGIDHTALADDPDSRRCHERRLDESRAYLDGYLGTRGGGFPIIELRARGQRPRFVQDANSRSGEVRSLLDQLTGPRRSESPDIFELPAGPRSTTPAPELARTYPGYGVLIGGPGLHHHMLVLADDERSSVLTRALPGLLRHVSERPASLSVQVLGVGSGEKAQTFSRRLCAARNAGLELPYLRYLSWPEARREELDPKLGEQLDALAERHQCPGSELPELEQGPPGPDSTSRRRSAPLASLLQSRDLWLDGMPSTTSEVERLDKLIGAPKRPPSLWQLMWTPYASDLDG